MSVSKPGQFRKNFKKKFIQQQIFLKKKKQIKSKKISNYH